MQSLPIDELIPEIVRTAMGEGVLVLEAPPGAGKTTRVPPALLRALPSGAGDVVVLEPRRIAARMAARRVAEEMGERAGETVGYTVRFEDVTSRATRVRFVTEGVLTRRFLSDPTLAGTRVVVLDEFHERHLQGDVALALVRRLRETSRPDLVVVVMSATLDAAPVAAYLAAPVLRSLGKTYEVTVDHAAGPDDRPLALQVAGAVRAALKDPARGDVLVFLPGAGEIRRATEACEKIAVEAGAVLLPLHGELPAAEQDRAVQPSAKTKVIVATNVAESSITIDGVVTVVDSGLANVAGFASWSGLPTLEVKKVSRASAAQRAGRAGRTRPGKCVRLYTRADFMARPEHDAPEIERLDLTQLRLELAALGGGEAGGLAWLDPPPEASMRTSTELLVRLGALDARGALTKLGKRLLAFPLHPRQARLYVEAEDRGVAEEGAVLTALVGERDIRARSPSLAPTSVRDVGTDRSDLLSILDLYLEAEASGFARNQVARIGLDPARTAAAAKVARSLATRRRAGPGGARGAAEGPGPSEREREDALLRSVLVAYPDRVMKRVGGRRLALAGGGSAELSPLSAVREAEWLVAVDADARRGATIVHVASAIEPDWLLELFPDAVREETASEWDAAAERVVTRSRLLYGKLALVESDAPEAGEEAARLLAAAARAAGARAFAPEGALDAWLSRVRFAAGVDARVAAPSDADVDAALGALCEGKRSFADLRDGLLPILEARLDPGAQQRLRELAPPRVTLPGGRAVKVEYEPGKPPWIASRLQDFFGMTEGPRVGGGRVPLVLHLLAPNKRAVQVTTDLGGFWSRHYPAVRKELARKYPRHAWPEDPTKPLPAGAEPRRR